MAPARSCLWRIRQATKIARAYQPVNSCLVPLPAVSGHEVYTVESLAESGVLCEAQRAMAERGGSQCGYCTPGFVVSMFAEQFRRDRIGFHPDALGGNLCRCTGYRPIRDAMQSLGPPRDSAMRRRLELPAAPVVPMHYESPGGRFSQPCSLAECLRLAANDDAAQFVAGNTDLGVMTNLRHRRFPHLISLDGVPELREFRDTAEAVEIGAGLTLTEIGERWTGAPDLFRDWLRLFASPLIRNRATLGGNLATASPIGDAAPMLLAIDAELSIASVKGERVIPLHSFFRAYRQTALERGELIRSVLIPKPLPTLAVSIKLPSAGSTTSVQWRRASLFAETTTRAGSKPRDWPLAVLGRFLCGWLKPRKHWYAAIPNTPKTFCAARCTRSAIIAGPPLTGWRWPRVFSINSCGP